MKCAWFQTTLVLHEIGDNTGVQDGLLVTKRLALSELSWFPRPVVIFMHACWTSTWDDVNSQLSTEESWSDSCTCSIPAQATPASGSHPISLHLIPAAVRSFLVLCQSPSKCSYAGADKNGRVWDCLPAKLVGGSPTSATQHTLKELRNQSCGWHHVWVVHRTCHQVWKAPALLVDEAPSSQWDSCSKLNHCIF